jgi:hypothetical protein
MEVCVCICERERGCVWMYSCVILYGREEDRLVCVCVSEVKNNVCAYLCVSEIVRCSNLNILLHDTYTYILHYNLTHIHNLLHHTYTLYCTTHTHLTTQHTHTLLHHTHTLHYTTHFTTQHTHRMQVHGLADTQLQLSFNGGVTSIDYTSGVYECE